MVTHCCFTVLMKAQLRYWTFIIICVNVWKPSDGLQGIGCMGDVKVTASLPDTTALPVSQKCAKGI